MGKDCCNSYKLDCDRDVLCNSDKLRCWKTEVRVVSCGVSATDFPFDEDGYNQSSSLILSAYPNTVGAENKGCIALTDNCCESVQTIGDWASLCVPTSLCVIITLTLNNGQSYNFYTTTGSNTLTPCNLACYDNENPIYVAPADAQPSPCLLLTLVQTVDYCAKTICWTINLDTTSDCIGASAIGSIIDVGCTHITYSGDYCQCYEYFNAYNMVVVTDGSCGTLPEGQVSYRQNFVDANGNNSIILTKGIIIDGDINTSDDCSENAFRAIISDVGLYPCQVYNFWAAAYSKPSCVGEFEQPYTSDTSGISEYGGSNPNNIVIYLTPRQQKQLFSFIFLWQVKYSKDLPYGSNEARLRFELCRSTSEGAIVPVTASFLYNHLRNWNEHIQAHMPADNCCYPLKTPFVKEDVYGSVVFIGIGDKCKPYNVFKTPHTGNDYEATLEPYSPSNLITASSSAWFGIRFASNQIDTTAPADTSCIC